MFPIRCERRDTRSRDRDGTRASLLTTWMRGMISREPSSEKYEFFVRTLLIIARNVILVNNSGGIVPTEHAQRATWHGSFCVVVHRNDGEQRERTGITTPYAYLVANVSMYGLLYSEC